MCVKCGCYLNNRRICAFGRFTDDSPGEMGFKGPHLGLNCCGSRPKVLESFDMERSPVQPLLLSRTATFYWNSPWPLLSLRDLRTIDVPMHDATRPIELPNLGEIGRNVTIGVVLATFWLLPRPVRLRGFL